VQRGSYPIAGVLIVVIVLVAGIFAGMYFLPSGPTASSSTTSTTNPTGSAPISSATSNSAPKIQVVAAENFWGSLISQLGGTRVQVLSIVSDPNADPHEYESNTANARAIADASLVIVNGAGYDDWALSLIGASNIPNQKVLNVQRLINQSAAPNPHFWYSPYYVNDTVKGMYNELVSIDPTDTGYFHQQYAALNASLWHTYMNREAEIKQQFHGAPVAATEDIFVYMANATGLNIVSPPEFMAAVAEGNDPSAQDVAIFQKLLQGGNSSVRVLVYNQQTVTPITQNIKSLAAQNQIPIVGLTETIQPPDVTFQTWMQSELIALQNGLNSQALGR
jgi:zinc/manganese transport system substrate-binding protein